MRKLTAAIVAALILAVPSTAGAAILNASGGAGAGGYKLVWTLAFDDAADTITVNATHARFSGEPALGQPQMAIITVQRSNGQPLSLNLLTDGTIFDGGPANMLDTGNRTRVNVRLRVSADRAAAFSFSTTYLPPLT